VPTGIKIGVSIGPWSVSRTPALALEPLSVCNRLNFKVVKDNI
jgi:hypothetical protein